MLFNICGRLSHPVRSQLQSASALQQHQLHTATVVRSWSCPSATPSDSLECMNRNKRKVNKANHGARPCNSVGRKARGLMQGSWYVSLAV